jgi:predicted nucleotidyltransferase component of viral defense system
MPAPDALPFRTHRDEVLFREALTATAAATGFPSPLIERDYFCSVILQHLASRETPLVFKGGTCFAKVHTGFYRLSEDLDFGIPIEGGTSRAQRSRLARPLKVHVDTLATDLPELVLRERLTGANNSTQYVAQFAYRSALQDGDEAVKFEIGLREPLLRPPVRGNVRTLLQHPVSGQGLVPGFQISCLSFEEAMAEKVRAALCRRAAAIRDYYDVDHAVERRGVRLDVPELVDLIRRKLAVPGNDPPDTSPARLLSLRPQVEAELAPVVRPSDLEAFDLDRAFAAVASVAAAVGRKA